MAAAQAAESHGMIETSPNIYNEGCIHQFQPEPTHKIH